MEKTINEVKQSKHELEKQIFNLLVNFEEANNITIHEMIHERIDVTNFSDETNRYMHTVKINLELL